MTDDEIYDFHAGTLPLLVSVPHDGRRVPADIEASLTPLARTLPDTDWYVARLYDFCRDLGASLIVARYSRYVVDLNRSPSDDALYPGQLSTGLCPSRTFAGQPIYADGKDVPGAERTRRTRQYWRPYHEQLQSCLEELTARHGYALLWDAHSIASRVPGLFEGVLPVLNIGTNDGSSCPLSVEKAVQAAAYAYTSVVNGRFRGGYITRRYGVPDQGWYAIQLELAQRCYMNEDTLVYDATLATELAKTLRRMLITFVDSAEECR